MHNSTRREFLVQFAGITLGTFTLPGWDEDQAGSPIEKSATAESLPVRQLVDFPQKGFNEEAEKTFLIWPEMVDGKVRTMFWYADTPEEEAELLAFYESTRNFGAKPEAQSLAGRLGDWLGLTKRSVQEQAAINAILDDPENLSHWLEYSKHLTARGDSQGKFIEAYCLMDGLEDDDPRLQAVIDQYWDAYDADVQKWFEPLRQFGLWPTLAGQFYPDDWMNQRAIVKVRIPRPGLLPDYAERLFDAVPLLMELELDYDELDAEGLAGMRQLGQIRNLKLSGNHLTHEKLKPLLLSPYWSRLRSLDIGYNDLSPATGRLLASSGLLDNLETLLASSSGLGSEGITAVAESPRAQKIELFVTNGNDLDDESVGRILRSPHLKSLKYLNLNDSRFTPETLSLLKEAVFAEDLLALYFTNCNLTTEHLRILAAQRLPSLVALYLDHNEIEAQGWQLLAEAPWTKQITVLSLKWCHMDADGAKAFAQGDWSSLEDLDLRENPLTDEGVQHLASSAGIRVTGELSLQDVECTSDGAAAIAQSAAFRNVRKLSLCENEIDNRGAKAIAAGEFPNLESLDLEDCPITGPGRKLLERRFGEIHLYVDED